MRASSSRSKLAWAQVTKTGSNSAYPVTCNHCNLSFKGGLSRVLTHLTGRGSGVRVCSRVPEETLVKLNAENAAVDAANAINKRNREIEDDLLHRSDTIGSSSSKKSKQTSIQESMSIAQCRLADIAVCKCFYAEGIPINKIRSPFFIEMCLAIAAAGSGYKPPSCDAARTTELAKAKDSIEGRLEVFNMRTKKCGATLCSDGWDDAASHPLLNFMLINPVGVKFVNSVDTSGHPKTSVYIASKLIEAAEVVGPENVVLLVTDGAAANCGAFPLVQQKYPHILVSKCVAHSIDLALADIFDLPEFRAVWENVKQLVTFVNNHHHTLAAYRAPVNGMQANMLLKPGETRFGTHFYMLQRAEQQATHLLQLVVSPGWADAVKQLNCADKGKAAALKQFVLDDSNWDNVRVVLNATEDLIRVMRVADGNAPSTGKIYNMMSKVLDHLSSSNHPVSSWFADSLQLQEQVTAIVRQRWEYLHSPILGAGYCLNPEYIRVCSENDECLQDLFKVIKVMLPNAEAQQKARLQFASYQAMEGVFSIGGVALKDAELLPPHQWWETYGKSTPDLAYVAIRVLSQVTSSGSCERNWSTYEYIHNTKRNKLTPARARDLVYVFTNERLLRQMDKADREEAFLPWDDQSDDEAEEGPAEEVSDDEVSHGGLVE